MKLSRKQRNMLIRISAACVIFAAVFAVEKNTDLNKYLYLLMYLPPYIVAGYDVLIRSVKNIGRGRIFDENFLMAAATVGAIVIGEYPESVFVMVFYQTGELFQNLAVEKSRRSISGLMDLSPQTSIRLSGDAEEEVIPEEISVGDVILLRPGDKVPVDGVIISGESSIDTKALTGESVPSDVRPGDRIISGCVNISGALKMEATAEYEDSAVAKILELVENSSLNKSKSEHFITKFARYYTPAVVISAVLLALIPSIITKEPADWCYRALIFLVVSCPCALVISIPLSYFGGIGGASSKGILIKGANYLEALAFVKTAVFDKTGTLTNGSFSVAGIYPADGISEAQLLDLAASAEYYSSHPLARPVKEAAGDGARVPDSVTELPGFGLKAMIGGKTVLAGNAGLMEKENIGFCPAETDGTAVYVAEDGLFKGYVVLRDVPKKNAAETVAALKNEGVKRCVMLTGDRREAAQAAAAEIGTDITKWELLPEDKVRFVNDECEKQSKNEKLLFAGDGINDAPVLSRADIGIAMGGIGSDAAIEAADAVIMDDDPFKIVTAVRIAKKTRRIVYENVIFALGVKFAVLVFAALGLTNMWVGVFADVGVAVIAILNAMRMLGKK